MDRRCVFGWLNEVYRNPTVAFNTYSDEQQIEFAHDALVLLKEQEAETELCERCGRVRLKSKWEVLGSYEKEQVSYG